MYHDVADYSHMHAGPGIVLVANDANVSIDESDDRRGLLYSRKSPLSGSNLRKAPCGAALGAGELQQVGAGAEAAVENSNCLATRR